ncbi:hypothetical protein [Aeromicrobium duanguangcaii]|uniref:4-amino-4-deoxy-L-arabinose transferase n=1 Tax=Aeromicrobium duanguangcaii TaxID=2968086 RepID=A0ABY5KGF4_9ACTN|nr:hypothetical protein [Aeromicrobium duanguangcaii]MCD9153365.1 hypothetical protein [Aeromicrobium duanguangcaii]UUI69542.1 hypothetical protein NP095_05450 [Aeromicrobium duanguangcaii]
MPTSTASIRDRIGRRLAVREHPWFWAVFAVLLVPIVFWFFSRLGEGWLPQGDDAMIATRAHDAWTGHWPLVGMRSTSDQTVDGVFAYHPGPLEFYVIGLPYLLSGWQVWGLLLGCALVLAAFVGVSLWSGYRAAGRPGLLVMAAATVTLYGLFGSVLVLPWNPWPTVFGLLASLAVAWRMLLGHRGLWPLFMVCVSWTGQAHLGVTPVVGLLGVWMLALTIRRWWRGYRSAPGAVGKTLIVTLVCWLGPLIEVVTYSPNNVGEILALTTAEKTEDTPRGEAWVHLTQMMFPWTRQWRDVGEVTWPAVVLLALGVLAVAWRARDRRHRRRIDPNIDAATSAVVVGLFALAACFWAGTRTGGDLRIGYLDFTMAGPVFFTAAVALWAFHRARLTLEQRGETPERLRSLGRYATVAALLLPVVGATAGWASVRTFVESGNEVNTKQARLVLDDLVPILQKWPYADLPVEVEGVGFTAWGSVGPAVSHQLIVEGRSVYYESWWPKSADDDHRRPRDIDGRRVVVRLEERAGDTGWADPQEPADETFTYPLLTDEGDGEIRVLVSIRDE